MTQEQPTPQPVQPPLWNETPLAIIIPTYDDSGDKQGTFIQPLTPPDFDDKTNDQYGAMSWLLNHNSGKNNTNKIRGSRYQQDIFNKKANIPKPLPRAIPRPLPPKTIKPA